MASGMIQQDGDRTAYFTHGGEGRPGTTVLQAHSVPASVMARVEGRTDYNATDDRPGDKGIERDERNRRFPPAEVPSIGVSIRHGICIGQHQPTARYLHYASAVQHFHE